MKKNRKKKIKRHIKWKSFFLFLFVLVFLFFIFYYITHLHIKNIYITGTTYITDKEVIEIANIKDYPKMIKYSNKTLKKKIKKLDLVEDVKIKKNIFGKLTIQITEAKVLFYNRNHDTYVLSNKVETPDGEYPGIPFLINYVPDDIYNRFIEEFAKLSFEARSLISEIEYSRSMSGDIAIDDTRFLLRMNDKNLVYINLINMDRLNSYPYIYTTFEGNGLLELDSDNDSVVFSPCKNILTKMSEENEIYQYCKKL